MYPKRGEKILARVHWGRTKKEIVGVFTGKVFRAKSGAVLGVLITEDGKKVYIPWTSDKSIIEFVKVK